MSEELVLLCFLMSVELGLLAIAILVSIAAFVLGEAHERAIQRQLVIITSTVVDDGHDRASQ